MGKDEGRKAEGKDLGSITRTRRRLFDVRGDELGHFEHAHPVFSVEDVFELVVGVNEGLVLLVLQVVAADVLPKFTRECRSSERLVADNGRQFLVWLHGFHEPGAGLPFALGLRCVISHKPSLSSKEFRICEGLTP